MQKTRVFAAGALVIKDGQVTIDLDRFPHVKARRHNRTVLHRLQSLRAAAPEQLGANVALDAEKYQPRHAAA